MSSSEQLSRVYMLQVIVAAAHISPTWDGTTFELFLVISQVHFVQRVLGGDKYRVSCSPPQSLVQVGLRKKEAKAKGIEYRLVKASMGSTFLRTHTLDPVAT